MVSSIGRHGDPTKLCADGRQARPATVPAVAAPLIVLVIMAFTSPPGDDWAPSVAVATFAGASVLGIVYIVLTWRVFAHASSSRSS